MKKSVLWFTRGISGLFHAGVISIICLVTGSVETWATWDAGSFDMSVIGNFWSNFGTIFSFIILYQVA